MDEYVHSGAVYQVQVSGDITSISVVFDRFLCVRIIAYQVCPETRQRISAYQCVSYSGE
jgi:hypothetical protein